MKTKGLAADCISENRTYRRQELCHVLRCSSGFVTQLIQLHGLLALGPDEGTFWGRHILESLVKQRTGELVVAQANAITRNAARAIKADRRHEKMLKRWAGNQKRTA